MSAGKIVLLQEYRIKYIASETALVLPLKQSLIMLIKYDSILTDSVAFLFGVHRYPQHV